MNGKHARTLVLIILNLLVGLRTASGQAPNRYWKWSPKKAYHAAVVQVSSKQPGYTGDFVGTGVYVKYKNLHGVLTARHVIKSRPVTVRFSNGMRVTTSATIDKMKHDLGFVYVSNPKLQPVPISNKAPQQGDRVEFLAKGGPTSTTRHFYGTYTAMELDDGRAGKLVEISGMHVVSGDSGSGVFNDAGEIIGINSCGADNRAVDYWGKFPIWPGAGITRHQDIVSFLDRITTSKDLPRVGQQVDWFT